VDMRQIIDAASANGKILELNANPHRLDLDWRQCIYAKKMGVRVAINPDAHSVDGFGDLKFGINAARKGWLEASDCISCFTLAEMTTFLTNSRRQKRRR